MQMKLG